MKNKEIETQKETAKKGRIKDYLTAPLKLFKLGNKPQWYTKNLGTTEVSAAVPTYFVQGLASSYPGDKIKGDARIAVYNYVNTIGSQGTSIADAKDSDIQFALNYFYAQTLQNNSRVPAEEAPEYGMYILAWTDVACAIAVATKALAVANKFNDQNTAFGKRLVQAIGFDYNDLVRNKPNYLAELNTLITEFNVNSAIPVGMSYYERKRYLASVILQDTKEASCSLSLFRQMYYWKFNDAINTCDTVVFGKAGSSYISMSDWLRSVRGMLYALKDSHTANMIKANLLSAIPVAKLERLRSIENVNSLADSFFITADLEREQLANVLTLPQDFNFDANSLLLGVTADGYLCQGSFDDSGLVEQMGIRFTTSADVQNGTVNIAQAVNVVPEILNFYHDNVTSEDVIEASRFRYVCKSIVGSTNALSITSCGTEVINSIQVFDGSNDSDLIDTTGTEIWNIVFPILTNTGNGNTNPKCADNYNAVFGWTRLLSFDWSPLFWIYPTFKQFISGKLSVIGSGMPDGGAPTTYELVGDIGKIITYPLGNAKTINSQANKSLFLMDASVFKQGF